MSFTRNTQPKNNAALSSTSFVRQAFAMPMPPLKTHAQTDAVKAIKAIDAVTNEGQKAAQRYHQGQVKAQFKHQAPHAESRIAIHQPTSRGSLRR